MSKLTFEELKTHLWHAAEILDEKGGIDPNDYRKPILGMLFLKRLNDVFEDKAISLEKNMAKRLLGKTLINIHFIFQKMHDGVKLKVLLKT